MGLSLLFQNQFLLNWTVTVCNCHRALLFLTFLSEKMIYLYVVLTKIHFSIKYNTAHNYSKQINKIVFNVYEVFNSALALKPYDKVECDIVISLNLLIIQIFVNFFFNCIALNLPLYTDNIFNSYKN